MILKELISSLDRLNVRTGDTICVFSDLTQFGVPKEIKLEVQRYGVEVLLEAYIETLISQVGPTGTVIMPAFTYSACEGEIFDLKESKSTVGALTELFRKKYATHRSQHPIFSFSGLGSKAADLMEVRTLDCFGSDSFFDHMIRHRGKYVLFGTTLINSGTFVYFSMQKMQVPYRYFKEFTGRIKLADQITEVKVPYYVRHLDSDVIDHWDVAEDEAIQKNFIIKEFYNGGRILSMEGLQIDYFLTEHLSRDEYFLTKRAA